MKKKGQGLTWGNWILHRVVGAVIIVVGLYMVLWGKTKDKAPFEPSKVLESPDEHMTVMNENDKELVVIDNGRGKCGDESVWIRNQLNMI